MRGQADKRPGHARSPVHDRAEEGREQLHMLCQVVLVSRATPATVSTPCRRAGNRLNAHHEPLACDLQARTAAPGPQVREGMPVGGKRAKSHETPFVPNEVNKDGAAPASSTAGTSQAGARGVAGPGATAAAALQGPTGGQAHRDAPVNQWRCPRSAHATVAVAGQRGTYDRQRGQTGDAMVLVGGRHRKPGFVRHQRLARCPRPQAIREPSSTPALNL